MGSAQGDMIDTSGPKALETFALIKLSVPTQYKLTMVNLPAAIFP